MLFVLSAAAAACGRSESISALGGIEMREKGNGKSIDEKIMKHVVARHELQKFKFH